jgi:hypothetical protein
VLTARYRLGMFQPPDKTPFASIGPEVIGSAEHKAAAVEAVEKGAPAMACLVCLVPWTVRMRSLHGCCLHPAFVCLFTSVGRAAGTVLLKNIASVSRRRMLPLDKAGKQRIVVAGPMVRLLPGDCLAAVCKWGRGPWVQHRRCRMSHLTDSSDMGTTYRLQAHTTEYLLGNYYGSPAGGVTTPFAAIKVCAIRHSDVHICAALVPIDFEEICQLMAGPSLNAHRTRWMAGGARTW